jgi:hypothetical protein
MDRITSRAASKEQIAFFENDHSIITTKANNA